MVKSSPVKIFIGSSSNGEDADMEMIYEYSLRKNTNRDVDITWMRQSRDTDSVWGGWLTRTWSTPFSGFRWAIPELCQFEGKAIYTDEDMINLHDIGDLYDTPMNGKCIMARKGKRFGGHEFCVMLIDCAKMKEHLIPISRMKRISETHHRFIHKFSGNAGLVGDLDPRWNILDGEDLTIDKMWQLHFTCMDTQPWKPAWFTGTPRPHPRTDLVDLWERMKNEALEAGCTPHLPNEHFGNYDIIGH